MNYQIRQNCLISQQIISAIARDESQPNIIFNSIQILKISSTRIKYSSFFSGRWSPPLTRGLLTVDLFNFGWLTILFHFMQAILLLVIEMTAACNYVRKFDYDSFRTGVNKLNHVLLFDRSKYLSQWLLIHMKTSIRCFHAQQEDLPITMPIHQRY